MFATRRRHRDSIGAPLASIDRRALKLVHRPEATPLNRAAVGFSHLGRGGLVWFGLAPLIGAGRRPLGRLEGMAISTVAIGSALCASNALARALGRPRPCHRCIRSLVPCPEGGSFPSDQAAAAFAAVEILGWFEPRVRTMIAGSAVIVAISRVVAGVHYPTDVIAGSLVGAAIGRAARDLAQRRSRP
jgi:undecaprenyl-diphosphatase